MNIYKTRHHRHLEVQTTMSTSPSLPTSTQAIHIRQSSVERSPVYHDIVVKTSPIPKLESGYILVKLSAAAFNRRDVIASWKLAYHVILTLYLKYWIRCNQYPGIAFDSILGSDGVGMCRDQVDRPSARVDSCTKAQSLDLQTPKTHYYTK